VYTGCKPNPMCTQNLQNVFANLSAGFTSYLPRRNQFSLDQLSFGTSFIGHPPVRGSLQMYSISSTPAMQMPELSRNIGMK